MAIATSRNGAILYVVSREVLKAVVVWKLYHFIIIYIYIYFWMLSGEQVAKQNLPTYKS